MTQTAYVYILASRKNGTLYTGVTNRKWTAQLNTATQPNTVILRGIAVRTDGFRDCARNDKHGCSTVINTCHPAQYRHPARSRSAHRWIPRLRAE